MSAVRPVDRSRRTAAIGGIVGPAAFVTAWAVNGARAPNYSPVQDAISRLASIDAPTRTSMTAGLVAYGVAVPFYARAVKASLPGPTWIAAAANGVATLALAALPLDRSSAGDIGHAVAAGAAYVTLSATALLAGRSLGDGRWARVATVAGVASGLSLAVSISAAPTGLFQRLGLSIGDAWIAASAIAIVRAGVAREPAGTA